MPMIMTHGWPPIFELLKAIGPLTDPTAHGASADDAFHVVVPSLPGFGFRAVRHGPAGVPTTSRAHGAS